MGITLHPVNKKAGNLDLNEYGNTVLRYLAWGFKKKHGIYAPMPKEDCIIVARMLRNKAHWLNLCGENNYNNTQESKNVFIYVNAKKDYLNKPWQIEMILHWADWFEKCGGLRDPEGYNEE